MKVEKITEGVYRGYDNGDVQIKQNDVRNVSDSFGKMLLKDYPKDFKEVKGGKEKTPDKKKGKK